MSFNRNRSNEDDLTEVYRHLGISEEECKKFEAFDNYLDGMSNKYHFGMPGIDDLLKANYYRDGIGFEKDLCEAYKHYTKAAREGNSEAMFNLGKMYRHGYGADKKDYGIAMNYFLSAVNSSPKNGYNCGEAENAIGKMYFDGLGVEKDFAKAVEWFQKATGNGYVGAKNNLEKVYKAVPSMLPPLERVKRDQERKVWILQNRENFFNFSAKKTSKIVKAQHFRHKPDPSDWLAAMPITLTEMYQTKDKAFSGCIFEARIIDFPFLKPSSLQTIVEDKNGTCEKLKIDNLFFIGSEGTLEALKTFHPNMKISILNPKMKLFKDGTKCIRADSRDFVKLDNSHANECCYLCGKEATIRSCSGCFMTKYCSKECQKFDWIELNHKKICKTLRTFHNLM